MDIGKWVINTDLAEWFMPMEQWNLELGRTVFISNQRDVNLKLAKKYMV